jgi:hypothetical protein
MLDAANQRTLGVSLSMKDAISIERWIFMVLISILGVLCSRELSRLSSSIEALAKTQTDQLALYHELKLELRSFQVEVRTKIFNAERVSK